MNFYTADLHMGHPRILQYCDRPFSGIGEMNETLISNWNSVVSKEDIVYVLGDMFFYDLDSQRRIMKRLNGKKILILGNHDKSAGTRKSEMKLADYIYVGWDEVVLELLLTTINKKPIGLVHDPALCNLDLSIPWLCGHVHNLFERQGNVINVGVDVNNFTPVSEEEIIRRLYV